MLRFVKTVSLLSLLLAFSSIFATTFKISPLSPSYQRQLEQKGLWKPSCPVTLERLRDVTVSYFDFKGKRHDNGHIIVLDVAAPSTLAIFKSLYRQRFPIHKIRPSSDYDGDDMRSMNDNNTSAFNCRPVTGKPNVVSIHSYGLSFDVNPLNNPYIRFATDGSGKAQVLPYQSIEYVNRYVKRTGMIELVVKYFERNGFFVWYGKHINPIDYQHFQPPRWEAQLLAVMTPKDGKRLFQIVKSKYRQASRIKDEEASKMIKLYRNNSKKFLRTFENNYLR